MLKKKKKLIFFINKYFRTQHRNMFDSNRYIKYKYCDYKIIIFELNTYFIMKKGDLYILIINYSVSERDESSD